MAAITASHPTLADMGKAVGPDRKNVAAVIEILDEMNPVLQDASIVEGNLPYGMQYSVRRYLPKGTWRRLYQGVQPTKSARAQVVESAARIEAYAEVDAAMPGDIRGLRADEVRAHTEGIAQQIAESIFYGDARANPAQFNGLAMRYADKTGAANSQNIVDAGGSSSDNRSIWFVSWGPSTCTLFYPMTRSADNPVPTSVAGVSHEDKGRVTVENLNMDGGRMEMYRDHLTAELGLCVKDWRYVVRLANIDMSDIAVLYESSGNITAAEQVKFLGDLWLRCIGRIGGNRMPGNVVAYADRELVTWFSRQNLALKQTFLDWGRMAGATGINEMRTPVIAGVPLKAVDALNRNEDAI